MYMSRRQLLLHAGCGCLAWHLIEFPTLARGAESGRHAVGDQLTFLPARAVQLEGYLHYYIELSLQHWSKGVVPYRALAAFFRTGRPTILEDGKRMELFATGEMWGKAVRSAALFYRYTGDAKLKQILKSTVADLLSTRRANGTISCTAVAQQPDGPRGDIWERTYVLLALDDFYEWVEPDPNVLKAMIDEADATLSQVGPPPKARIVDLGWSGGLVGGNNIESSTILEPIMRLHRRTGYPRYLEFARYIVETEGGSLYHRIFDEVLSGENPMAVGGVYPKGYEMTSLFEGLTEYYRVTGNERWKSAAVQYYHKVIEQEITLIGNGGGDQPYHPNVRGEAWDNTAYEQTNPDIGRMMETCTGVTWLKFCSQILRLTADSTAVDYMELYAYNGLIGAMKPEGDGFSYVNLLNGVKTNREGWGTEIDGVYVTCCNLNGPEGLAYLPLVAVMSDREGPVVNFYNAGSAQVPLSGDASARAHLEILTTYPLDGEIRIKVSPASPRRFAVKLRIPAWSERTTVTTQGQSVAVHPGSYARIEREWSAGDVIELHLDMRCRLVKARHGLHEGSDRFHALLTGPIVLARDENIDACFAEPVDIIATDGIVAAKPVKPTLPGTNIQFEIPTRTGVIAMVDYASVNSWQGKHVQTWLPIAGTSI